ncbi:MAG: RsmG family class I SAM-dependent methyltransferase [Acidimicrobiales bacterium]
MPGADDGGDSPALVVELLGEARALGFLGPGPMEPQIRHAQGFGTIARRLSPGAPVRLVDLGSGGGLPALVVATGWPACSMTLLEANGRRAAFLRRAVERLGLGSRVTVLEERAEVSGRQDGLRAGFDGALARSFGRPAVVAECAAPLLRVGGWLLVSEPPQGDREDQRDDRWPAEPLGQLGLETDEVVHEGFEYRVLRQVSACPERFPRRNGVPAKRPLF